MPDTYVARARGFPASAGNCILAMYNELNSGYVINVEDIWIESPSMTQLASAYQGAIEVKRISALAGGDDLSVTKLDSSNQAIPSDILIRENAIPTLTADASLSQVVPSPMFKSTDAMSVFSRHGMGLTYTNQNNSIVYYTTPATSNSPITLRQNEGICFHLTATPFTQVMQYSIIFKIAGVGNETYILEDECSLWHSGQTPVAIFNGNSSAVIEVHEIVLKEAGDYTIPLFAGVPIGGLMTKFATTVTPTKRDSAAPNVPSTVTIVKDCPVKPVAPEYGGGGLTFGSFHSRSMVLSGFVPYGLLQSGIPCYFACSYTMNVGMNWHFCGPGVRTADMLPSIGAIRLFPGYGLAIIQLMDDSTFTSSLASPQGASIMGTVEARMVFSIEDAIGRGSAS